MVDNVVELGRIHDSDVGQLRIILHTTKEHFEQLPPWERDSVATRGDKMPANVLAAVNFIFCAINRSTEGT